MIPRTLSASSLHVSELCMSRWFAENIMRGRGEGNSAASLGSSVHGALEYFVKAVYLEKNNPRLPSFQLLEDFYRISFMSEFNTSDCDGPEWEDGLAMLKKWYNRTSFDGVTVLSCEVKEFFEVKFPNGVIVPFNYIWDRFDQIGPNEYKVVDYKSIRWALKPEDLDVKIQARFYGLAVQIKYPEAEKIWVEFDQLRHDPIGMVFTKEDNIATWNFLKSAVKRIYNHVPELNDPDISEVDEEEAYDKALAAETLNSECKWCVRKTTCKAVKRNANVGGIHSFTSVEDMVDARAKLEYQAAAAKTALDELDKMLIAEAQERDTLEFVGSLYRANIGVSARRAVDGERVEQVIGQDLFKKYGSMSITLADIDKLLKGNELSPYEKKQLEGLIYRKIGEPKVKTEKITMFGDKE